MRNIISFKNIAVLIFLIGLVIWGIAGWFYYQSRFLPVSGSSDMIRRTSAINDAIIKGEKDYFYESDQFPAMPNLNN